MPQSRTLLLKDALLVATMDDARTEIAGGSVLVRDREIVAVGPAAGVAATADEVFDCRGKVVVPGLVNTHHHFFQTLTRAVPAAQNADLFGWLRTLYPMWQRLTPDMLRVSATTALVELALSGCSTTSDHLYLYPNGGRLDDTIEAARDVGLRFHACRGAMTVGESQGGLPPDALVEREDDALRDMRRVIETFHDPSPLSMLRIACAPCSPFSVSPDFMRESAALARACGVGLHTHLAENDDDVAYTRERFGCTPAEYAHDAGWTGSEVWHAHCVKLDDRGIRLFADTATGVAHCPTSNMRLASGIAPVRRMRDAHVKVGLGVDGSASNDSSHLLAEARQALLLARVNASAAALDAREALWLATRGGAGVLGRNDIGHLAPGMAADVAVFDLDDIAFAGALHDPLAALVFCAPARVWASIANGKVVVRNGLLTTVETARLAERHRQLARSLLAG
jgi:cytosine/adenosine deaminase-related metal-dependent hydrolase